MQPDNDCTAALKRQMGELRKTEHDTLCFAKKGYASYARTTDGKNCRGEAMPEWDNLDDLQKQAWVEAAKTISMCATLDGSRSL